jgi:formamidopyrimidine-DNA glycosylase
MPELPDVEYFTSYFKRTSLHKKIDAVKCLRASLLKKITQKDFVSRLEGKKFQDASRRGKFLIASLKGTENNLILHFGMTGDLQYRKMGKDKAPYDEVYAKVVFQFRNGYELLWINKRKFGKVYLVDKPERIDLIRQMGPEPLEISKKDFLATLEEKKRKNVKSFLMDQRDIAGIGNEYSNEILFRCGIHPKKRIQSLKEADRKQLYKTMKSTLKKAIRVEPPKG